MNLVRSTTKLVMFTIVLYASALSPTPGARAESTPLYVGVYVVYDLDLHYTIEYPQGYEHGATEGSPRDYFLAFVSAVDLRFREIEGLNVRLSLVSATPLSWSQTRSISVDARGYHESINGAETMKNLWQEVNSSSGKYDEGDVLFYLTRKFVLTQLGSEKEWLGVAKKGQVCKEKVGLLSDDGKTFSGVEEMFRQLALLLGASRDSTDEGNNCSTSNYHLLSSIYGGWLHNLSSCSTKDLLAFVADGGNTDCLKDEPQNSDKFANMLPADYHTTYGYDICTAGYSGKRGDVRKCEDKYRTSGYNETCRVECCEHDRTYIRRTKKWKPYVVSRPTAADGAMCEGTKICLHGECKENHKSISSRAL